MAEGAVVDFGERVAAAVAAAVAGQLDPIDWAT